MNILQALKSYWSSLIPEPVILDHVAIETKRKRDWRINAVRKASERHGKPFKVAPDGVPREVMRDGAFRVVGQNLVEVRRMSAK